jgi:signal peptidase I
MRSVVELTMTVAPRSSRVLAAANPIPSALPAPVTSARLPASETDTARDGNYIGAAMLILKALSLLVGAVILASVLRGALGPKVKAYRVPSEAMVPTVQVGEHIMGNFDAYGDDAPKVGDIVLINPPTSAQEDSQCGAQPEAGAMCAKPTAGLAKVTFIKRVVGLPGDKLSLKDGRVIRNGRRLAEPYAAPCVGESCDFPKPITVPPGHYFTLGDNRGSSDDSRFWGPVPRKAVLARVDDCAPVIRLFCHARD